MIFQIFNEKMPMMNFAVCFLAAAVVMVAGNPGYGYKPMAAMAPAAYMAPSYSAPPAPAYQAPAAPSYSPPAYSPPAYSPPAYQPPTYKAPAYMVPAAPSYNKKSSY